MSSTSQYQAKKGFVVGLDLGQSQDFTAITVVERIDDLTSTDDVVTKTVRHHHLRHAQRLRLGTPYPDIVEIMGRMVTTLQMSGSRVELVVDGTGVGKPVIDMMRKAKLRPISVAITGGREEGGGGDFNHTVPKRNLVSSLLVTFQAGRLKMSSGIAAIDLLENELLNFKVRISASGHDSYDAWRESVHDDLVLSAALAVWWGERGTPTRSYTHYFFDR